jgi:hypothetical protein
LRLARIANAVAIRVLLGVTASSVEAESSRKGEYKWGHYMLSLLIAAAAFNSNFSLDQTSAKSHLEKDRLANRSSHALSCCLAERDRTVEKFEQSTQSKRSKANAKH